MIKKSGNRYVVYWKGRKIAVYYSKSAAVKRLRELENWKLIKNVPE